MPIRTRRELLRLAERYRLPIVEDATYRELYFTEAPPPSLRELDAQNIVIHLSSFSKVLAPGLRLGWLSAAPSIVDQIALIKQRLDPHTQNLVQFAMARLLQDGSFDRHLRTLRAEHARRCAGMLAAIQRAPSCRRAPVRPAAGGLYLWCRRRVRSSTRLLLEQALAAGVAFVPGHAFYPDPAGDAELRLCFSSVMPAAIDDAVGRLAGVLTRLARPESPRTSSRSQPPDPRQQRADESRYRRETARVPRASGDDSQRQRHRAGQQAAQPSHVPGPSVLQRIERRIAAALERVAHRGLDRGGADADAVQGAVVMAQQLEHRHRRADAGRPEVERQQRDVSRPDGDRRRSDQDARVRGQHQARRG